VDTASADKNDLKDYWVFIGFRGLDWREARLEDVGEFVSWLQLPPAGMSHPAHAAQHQRCGTEYWYVNSVRLGLSYMGWPT